MDITFDTDGGKPTLTVTYDPSRLSLFEALEAGMVAYGIKSYQPVKVVAIPMKEEG
jgi:hypothetical protein